MLYYYLLRTQTKVTRARVLYFISLTHAVCLYHTLRANIVRYIDLESCRQDAISSNVLIFVGMSVGNEYQYGPSG